MTSLLTGTTMTASLPTGAVTFLFTDIEGSTERWEHHRAAMQAALERHDALLRAAIESHHGHVFKTVGDAFCAAFHTPLDALAAAVDAQRAVAAEDWSGYGAGFPSLSIRMGVHTGVAQERGGDYFGPAVNRTARLEAAGHGGQVLLSMSTQQLVQGDLPADWSVRDWGTHRLKDLRYADRIFQLEVVGLQDVATPLRTATALSPRDRIIVEDSLTEENADLGSVASAEAAGIHRPVNVYDALAATLAAVRGDEGARAVVLTAAQAREAASLRPANLEEYRLGRIAEWSQPRYRLDGRFVALTLLVDQGEDAAGGRWAAKQERYEDLGALLAAVPEPAVVVLGSPGSGKSTLLRHLELDVAIEGLRGEGARWAGPHPPNHPNAPTAGAPGTPTAPSPERRGRGGDLVGRVTFFIQLNQYKPAEPGQSVPSPERWLATHWAERNPDLPPLETLLGEGRMILLLDAVNEMPAASEREFRERVGLWKDWLVHLNQTRPGNRAVFSCRTLDYSAPLSTPALRVPQVQIEPLTDAQVAEFLRAYSPVRGEDIWAAIAGSPQLEALRAPFFLALLVDQVEATGDLAGDRAGLFTGFVRQALRREVERDNPLFAVEAILASRDMRRIAQWQWRDAYELPERGALVPRLAALAYGMQQAEADGEASQVRLDYDTALELVDHAVGEDIVKAGLAISVLDEDPAADEVLYRHQLVQEYFAARVLAREPRPELVAAPWRVAEIRPSVREILETLPPGETLPALPQTGWEETTLLAVAMSADAEGYIGALMGTNLALAGRCAGLAEVRGRLSELLLNELRWALVGRSRDAEADLRERIAAGLAVGALGDPRFERREGLHGAYLMPSLVEITGGMYPIGEDEPIEWAVTGVSRTETAHIPRHEVEIAPFQMAQFPTTNAEWRCFMEAGGYEDEQWWDTEDARAWRQGELANEGAKVNNRIWRKRFQENAEIFEQMVEEGRFPSEEAVERWRGWMVLDDAGFEAALAARWQAKRATEPEFWQDERFNAASQPVVGICWYEARAYCNWLGAQMGLSVRLPTEVEWEAAARGAAGRLYAYGNAFEPTKGNTIETHVRRTTPVGVFVEGDTPEGVSDLAGNVQQSTSSAWGGEDDDVPEYGYPYDPNDGREDPNAPPSCPRVWRGGAWDLNHGSARAACRDDNRPDNRDNEGGFRCVFQSPISGGTGL
jgi:formylglycine-generating enzyme required for sulfatase activity/class 3 adenylate cyclase